MAIPGQNPGIAAWPVGMIAPAHGKWVLRLRIEHFTTTNRTSLSLRLASAGLLLLLAGCVTAPQKPGDGKLDAAQLGLDPQIVPLAQEEAQQIAGKPRAALAAPVRQPQLAASEQSQPAADMASTPMQAQPNIGGLALQPTGINPSRASIFAAPRPATIAPLEPTAADVPAFAPTPSASPAVNSIQQQAPKAPSAAPSPLSQKAQKADPRFAGLPFRRNDYIGADDIPLAMAANFYASKNLYTPEDGDDAPAGLMKLASLSGMARNAAHGLRIQRPDVQVGCFKPELVGLIKSAERHFGTQALVTSGYRDPAHNRRVGGALHSLHMKCDAADIQLAGVSKWDLAKFLRAQPGRGGVGTYCHTPSVHIDIGRPRDWNWRCRRDEV